MLDTGSERRPRLVNISPDGGIIWLTGFRIRIENHRKRFTRPYHKGVLITPAYPKAIGK